MKKHYVKYLWMVLAVGIVCLTYGCGQIPAIDRVIQQQGAGEQIEHQKDQSGSIPNFQGIADALGCVFAPQSCKN